MIHLKINNIDITVKAGSTILEAAREYNIKIPTLCYYPDLNIKSDCRICVVEIEGQKGLVTSCSTIAREGMIIKTNSPRVLNARKTITELILANHDANCTACVRNMECELQRLANKLGIDENRFESVLQIKELDTNNPSIVRNPNRCIKCGRCIDVCKTVQGLNVLEIMNRSHDIIISPAFGKSLNDLVCVFCGQCASVCPVGAITEKDDTDRVWKALHEENKHVIVQVAPAVRVSLGEELGAEPGMIVTGKMVAALKLLGFDRVFDTDFTADLTVIEEGYELINRIKSGGVLPMITSCCPGWINYAEQRYSDLIDHLSTCKSPQQMFGSLAKTYYARRLHIDPKDIFVVSIMPCTAKKYEANRKEMRIDGIHPDVDAVLTTRELGKMIDQMGVDFLSLDDVPFDDLFGITSGAAAVFGATGGVMEAALRTVSEVVNGTSLPSVDFMEFRGLEGVKVAEVMLGGSPVKVAVAHTLSNAKPLLEEIREGKSEYAFIEIMACPGGCIGGGGQPYGTIEQVRLKRIDASYIVDKNSAIRKSHENPTIVKLYEDFLGEPLGYKSHQYLHTHYHPRNEHKEQK